MRRALGGTLRIVARRIVVGINPPPRATRGDVVDRNIFMMCRMAAAQRAIFKLCHVYGLIILLLLRDAPRC